MMDTRVLVHVDLRGVPMRVGRLWIRVRGGRESASFEYDSAWTDHPLRLALEPALTVGPGPYHTRGRLFGSIGDSAPLTENIREAIEGCLSAAASDIPVSDADELAALSALPHFSH